MRTLYLKLILFMLLGISVLTHEVSTETILVLLLYLCFILLNYVWTKPLLQSANVFALCILSLMDPRFALGVSLGIFPSMHPILLLLMLSISWISLTLNGFLVSVGCLCAVWMLTSFEKTHELLKKEKLLLFEQLTSHQLHAEQEQEALIVQQQQALELSLLNERNRIARDIHDNVGHLLTSALLQVGAMKAINPQGDFDTLKDTLDKGMNSIRLSVHSLYNDSFNLDMEIRNSLQEYDLLEYDYKYAFFSDPSSQSKSTFLFIVKEALNNIVKHSNATKVSLHFDESEQNYHCLIQDNNTLPLKTNKQGIGLQSLEKRVKEVHGILNIQPENGFRIYVNIPKEETL